MDKIYSRRRLNIQILKNIIFNKFSNNKNSSNNGKFRDVKGKVVKIIAVLGIAFFTVYKMLDAIEEIVDKQCQAQAKMIATKISNQQASIVISKYKYEDLFKITKDSNGNILMINANVITVNAIISDIAVKIQEEINNEKNNSFNLKLGSLTGSKFFAGRGPDVKIKLETVGNLDTDLKSEFESQGINQTLHKLYLEVECNVIILTPYKTIEDKIKNQVLLSESVIIGTTPETYFNLTR